MRRIVALGAVVGAFALVGVGGASGSCPGSSHNPGGTPPNCGHTPPPAPPPACDFANPPTGPISGIVGKVGEGIGDNQLGNLVVDVGCALQKDLGL
jgi:hypothetical protein